mgnify:CR=1 FL=1
MNEYRIKAYAKINLGLDVVRRLENGYHEVKMVMQTVGIYDVLDFERTDGGIVITTDSGELPTDENNLIYKAAKLMMETYPISGGVKIHLEKHIPIAAGMAGGSTDAAAVFKGINIMYNLNATEEELKELGVTIGADIPYCIMGGTALACGIGEKLTRLPGCPKCYFVIGKPYVNVSTKYVYENLVLDESTVHPDTDAIIDAISHANVAGIADNLCNVLETVTVAKYPQIGEIKKIMIEKGALNSLMSGSGPTVFGIFTDYEKAKECNDYLRKSRLVKSAYVAEPVSARMCKGR